MFKQVKVNYLGNRMYINMIRYDADEIIQLFDPIYRERIVDHIANFNSGNVHSLFPEIDLSKNITFYVFEIANEPECMIYVVYSFVRYVGELIQILTPGILKTKIMREIFEHV